MRAPAGAGALSASSRESLERLAGHWQGIIWETPAWYLQGFTPIEVTIGVDGAWRGTIGAAQAWGRTRVRGDRVVLAGTARSSTGHEDAVYFLLTGDGTRRWAHAEALFIGRAAPASVSLKRP